MLKTDKFKHKYSENLFELFEKQIVTQQYGLKDDSNLSNKRSQK